MKSNTVNVLDLELTCWANNIVPPGQVKQVIEVGLCMVDISDYTIVKTISMPVIPTLSEVSEYCTQLTGWTLPKLRKQGTDLAEVSRRLREKYGSINRLLVVDSADEVPTFRAQCELVNAEFPLGDEQLNVTTLFQLATGLRGNLGLDQMLATLGMQFEGTRHKAADDAHNIARLFLALLKVLRTGFFTRNQA